jgi:thioredoxin-like negative regulator of GroEL
MKRILKFEAPWCTKCKQMDKVMEGMHIPFHVEKIDVEDNIESTIFYGIKGIPHMIILDENNNILQRISGTFTQQQLEEALQQ